MMRACTDSTGSSMARKIAAPTPEAQALAGVLTRYIAQHYVSVRDAARTWDMNDSTLGKIMNTPTRVPRPETMRQLAAGMNMSLRELYALCGITDTAEAEASDAELNEAALRGLDMDARRLLSRMTPEQKAKLLDLAHSFLD